QRHVAESHRFTPHRSRTHDAHYPNQTGSDEQTDQGRPQSLPVRVWLSEPGRPASPSHNRPSSQHVKSLSQKIHSGSDQKHPFRPTSSIAVSTSEPNHPCEPQRPTFEYKRRVH